MPHSQSAMLARKITAALKRSRVMWLPSEVEVRIKNQSTLPRRGEMEKGDCNHGKLQEKQEGVICVAGVWCVCSTLWQRPRSSARKRWRAPRRRPQLSARLPSWQSCKGRQTSHRRVQQTTCDIAVTLLLEDILRAKVRSYLVCSPYVIYLGPDTGRKHDW